MSDRPIHVLVAADRRFIWGCAVTIRSMIDNLESERPLHVRVVHDSLRPGDQKALLESWTREDGHPVNVSFSRLPSETVAGLVRSKALSRMTYARLLIGDLVGDHVDRCIYVDSDLLFERSVAELDEFELGNSIVGAVPNGLSSGSEASDVARLSLPAQTRYMNAGILAVDLKKWREADVGRTALTICKSLELRIPDQDSLNLALAGNWVELPNHWNSWAARTDSAGSRVIHYTMTPKPWDADYRGRFSEEFYHYLDRTVFSGRRPPRLFGVAPALTSIRRKFPYLPTVWRLLKRSVGSTAN